MEPEMRNLVIALVATMAVLFVWQIFWIPPPKTAPEPMPEPIPETMPEAVPQVLYEKTPETVPRILIKTPRLSGSLDVRGARLDTLYLKDYRQNTDADAPPVQLLVPDSQNGYAASWGWLSGDTTTPQNTTVWQQKTEKNLTVDHPVELVYRNPEGVEFRQIFSVDQNYMFFVTQEVKNTTSTPIQLQSWGRIKRQKGIPEGHYSEYLVHQGFTGVFDKEGLEEISFGDIKTEQRYSSRSGWLGISTKYWATILIPEQNQPFFARFARESTRLGVGAPYVAEFTTLPVSVAPGETVRRTTQLFAGAKVLSLVKAYEKTQNVPRFDLLIDWGWFYFLTRPMFAFLFFLFQWTGDFGIAILLATVIVRVCLLPLTLKSMFAMHKMSALQPQMKALQDRFKDEPQRLNKEIFALYREKKVNPLSGCLPMLPQIPIFFALYRVLLTTIEMRHVPFWGWIQDLSAPDPTSLFNLFGWIDWDPPYLLQVGGWPILMGLSMFALMRLNPRAKDATDQMKMVYKLHPVIAVGVAYLISGLPAGLIIYMTWSNLLSMLQTLIVRWRSP